MQRFNYNFVPNIPLTGCVFCCIVFYKRLLSIFGDQRAVQEGWGGIKHKRGEGGAQIIGRGGEEGREDEGYLKTIFFFEEFRLIYISYFYSTTKHEIIWTLIRVE